MNTLPTSDAVLDALVKSIVRGHTDIVFGTFVLTGDTNDTQICAFALNELVKAFPATREGLTQALLFAGLRIEGGDNATA